MKNKDRQIIEHMLTEIELLDEVTPEAFKRQIVQRGVTQCIINVAELAKLLSDDFKRQTADYIPWRKFTGIRNIAAHKYGTLDMRVIWNIVEVEMPVLKVTLKRKLRKSGNE